MGKTFGGLIADVRQGKGLTVYALAQATGLSDQAIHDLERSDRMPTFDTARRLAGALGISLDWIANQLPAVELPDPTPKRPRGRPRKADAGGPPAVPAQPDGGPKAKARGRKPIGQ
jgi:transcriptional regulator with XRE-family HTH domain